MIDAYFHHVGPTTPIYDRTSLYSLVDTYFLQIGSVSDQLLSWSEICERHSIPELLAPLASVCAMLASVAEVMPTSRLIVWGVVDDADSIAKLCNELANAAVECFVEAFRMGECSLAMVQAGATLFVASHNK
jgi:hypothetical protein